MMSDFDVLIQQSRLPFFDYRMSPLFRLLIEKKGGLCSVEDRSSAGTGRINNLRRVCP